MTFEYKVLGSGPVRAAVEMNATNVFPDRPEAPVSIRAFIYAGRAESGSPCCCPRAWRTQASRTMRWRAAKLRPRGAPANGATTATTSERSAWRSPGGPHPLSAVLSREAERHVVTGGRSRHLLDPRRLARGMQYPVSYDGQNWEREIREWAAALHADLAVSVGRSRTRTPMTEHDSGAGEGVDPAFARMTNMAGMRKSAVASSPSFTKVGIQQVAAVAVKAWSLAFTGMTNAVPVFRHSHESGNPAGGGGGVKAWSLAFTGMTNAVPRFRHSHESGNQQAAAVAR